MKYSLWLFFALLFACPILKAQSIDGDTLSRPVPMADSQQTEHHNENLFIIRSIFITGNKKTKPDIILRELSFKQGDKYKLQDIVAKFQRARENLLNTSLFNDAIVALKSFEGYNVDVLVEVKERWYLFPLPYFRPIDRNLNQWIVEQHASLSRVNYGVKLLYNNATGRNDKLSVWLMSGYTHQFSFGYDRLYIDKALRWGMNVKFALGEKKEVNYNTIENKQAFIKDSSRYLQSFMDATIELTYRKAIKTRHRFGIGYHVQSISDTIAELNPSYYLNGRTHISYPEFFYTMNYYDLDYIPYPTSGYAAEVTLSKKGLDHVINAWQLNMQGSANWHLSKKTYFNLRSFSTIKLPFKQPFFNQGLLGYGDVFMQGYEYYVIDGVAGGYLKAAITRELVTVHGNFLKRQRDEPLRIPFRVFAKVYGNAGYIYNPQPGNNFLVNRMLYSGGFGIDILTYYDFTFKLEFTFNQLGKNGLFLHKKSNF
ncbi:MAG: hypothetical protein LC128_02890 [Chitinophagales bacterium]|nr:hypothetical protein [Chitinophagales bacterium]